MKQGNNHRGRKVKVDHVLLMVGGLIRTIKDTQATIELLDGRIVTKHLVYENHQPQMTYAEKTLRRGKQELRVLFFSRVTTDKQQFEGDKLRMIEDNQSPESQMNAFIEAWCAGEEDKANEIIAT